MFLQILAVHRLDARAIAQNRTTQILSRKNLPLKNIENMIVRRIETLRNFLNHNPPLRPQLLFGKTRVANHIAKNLQSPLQMLARHAHVKRRLLARSVGVDHPATRLDVGSQTIGVAQFGPFEQHMLVKMRQPRTRCRITTRSRPNPNSTGQALDAINFVYQRSRAAGKNFLHRQRGNVFLHAKFPTEHTKPR